MYCWCVLLSVVGCSCVLLCVVACYRGLLVARVVDPYSFFTDPDPDLGDGGQYGSGSESGSNTDPGL